MPTPSRDNPADPDAPDAPDAWKLLLRDALERKLRAKVENPAPPPTQDVPPRGRDARATSAGRPIAFNGEMVRALLTGRKMQTRRLPHQPAPAPLEQLWVRERWAPVNPVDPSAGYRYAADEPTAAGVAWRPGRFMPRAAARLGLWVVSTRREPLTSITEADAAAEGYPRPAGGDDTGGAVAWFRDLWQSIYGGTPNGWDANPTVTVISFLPMKLPPGGA